MKNDAGEDPDLCEALADHDRAVEAAGLAIWVGGEPTFTERRSSDAAWVFSAVGADKKQRAQILLAYLAAAYPGAAMLRAVGRQYPGEDIPRWSYGLWARRDGTCVWSGPPDPLLRDPPRSEDSSGASIDDSLENTSRRTGLPPPEVLELATRLAERLETSGAAARVIDGRGARVRVLWRFDGDHEAIESILDDPRLDRPAVDETSIPTEGLRDLLSEEGHFLATISTSIDEPSGREATLRVDLPSVRDVARFESLLETVGASARAASANRIILGGYPPPTDGSVAWTTITPDPGVIEVNMAPCEDVTGYYRDNRLIFAAAENAGLSPMRLHFNGDVSDSGGGGQLTFGGPTPELSPFFVYPRLLPRLVVYLNRHPSLSYFFAFDSIGGSSQSPRADENLRESFAELEVALELLERVELPSPETTWRSLAPFLADRFGNSHRSEINIEKLWNPHLPGRGRSGLVELRALRMARTPKRAAAVAALFRAIIARLARAPDSAPNQLADWGAELHDRFALPSELARDLIDVFTDLRTSGFGLHRELEHELLEDRGRRLGRVAHGPFEVEVRRAIEFWPLVGDQSGQRGTSRLIDASTVRLEIVCTSPSAGIEALDGLRVGVDGFDVTPALEHKAPDPALVLGIRYRAFAPAPGLHPTLPPHGPVAVSFLSPRSGASFRLTVHSWRPSGAAYDGLPNGLADAERRRRERLVVEPITSAEVIPLREPPLGARTRWAVDTRRL